MAVADTLQQQLDISFTAHFDLVTIHPFYDGNGRQYKKYLQQEIGAYQKLFYSKTGKGYSFVF